MKKTDERLLYQGDWLRMKEIVLANASGDPIRWEMVERRASRTTLAIHAILQPSGRHLLIRQFRPPIGGWILTFPAGVAESEDIAAEAVRELKEETGYLGRVMEISPRLKVNAAIMNENSYLVSMEVDETDPDNANPRQALDPAEEIQVHLVETDRIREFLLRQQACGTEIGSGLWYLFGYNHLREGKIK